MQVSDSRQLMAAMVAMDLATAAPAPAAAAAVRGALDEGDGLLREGAGACRLRQ